MIGSAAQYTASFTMGEYDTKLISMYGEDQLTVQKKRYGDFLQKCQHISDTTPITLFSGCGRTEIGGNHTDHNHGNVLAAGVHLDCICGAYIENSPQVTLHSPIFSTIKVDLNDLQPRQSENGTPESIIRGVAGEFARAGFSVCGFTGCLDSTIPMGSGLSSSAAFEVLIANIFNTFANHNKISKEQIALIAQTAENIYFGKPCGLMDQLSCAVGGLLHIDFDKPEKPVIHPVTANLEDSGHQIVIVNTGSDHSDLTPEYAAIPEEMLAAAHCLGKEYARDISLQQLQENTQLIREKCGDRSLLRLYHFITENQRAIQQAKALEHKDFETFFQLVRQSADSSYRFLQNCYSTITPARQPIATALALSEMNLGETGCSRVHGGGFEGTIQAFVPQASLGSYISFMESHFGSGSVVPLHIRPAGHDYFVL